MPVCIYAIVCANTRRLTGWYRMKGFSDRDIFNLRLFFTFNKGYMNTKLRVSKFCFLLFFLFSSFSGFTQTLTVAGKVVDATGRPLEGATVLEKGKNKLLFILMRHFYFIR